ncbi:MAG TPA: hypothetical protein DEA08_16880 [Planctomycetes bacterium]|nr:hypothetical protein [Planctomycetota bacterium]
MRGAGGVLAAVAPQRAHVHIALRAARQGDDEPARRHLLLALVQGGSDSSSLPASDPHVLLAERSRRAKPPLGRPAPLAGVAPLASCSLGRSSP